MEIKSNEDPSQRTNSYINLSNKAYKSVSPQLMQNLLEKAGYKQDTSPIKYVFVDDRLKDLSEAYEYISQFNI